MSFATPVQISEPLHSALLDLASGCIRFEAVGCPPRFANNFVHALICLDCGVYPPESLARLEVPLESHIVPNHQPAFKVHPITVALLLHALDHFDLGELAKYIEVAPDSFRVSEDYGDDGGTDGDPAPSQPPVGDSTQPAPKKKVKARRYRPLDSSFSADDGADFVCLRVRRPTKPPAAPKQGSVVSGFLQHRSSLNELLAYIQSKIYSAQETSTIAALLVSVALGSTPMAEESARRKELWEERTAPCLAADGGHPFALDELRVYIRIDEIIRSNPHWRTAVRDDVARTHKWKQESLDEHGFTPSMAKYLVDKLRWLATDPYGPDVDPTAVPGVYSRRSLLDADAASELKQAIEALRTASVGPQTARRGRPLMMGRAQTFLDELRRPSRAGWDPAARGFKAPYAVNAKHEHKPTEHSGRELAQWIPTEVRSDPRGSTATFLSYINNLSPFEPAGRRLYAHIGKAFAAMLPMFEVVLASYPAKADPAFYSGAAVTSSLQVVVRLSKQQLTPDVPSRKGGGWHYSGTPAENICATGIYYLDCENIEPPSTKFITAVGREALSGGSVQHLDDGQQEYVFGLSAERLKRRRVHSQALGSTRPMAGSCFVYPNHLQAKTANLNLVDRTRPGHVTMLEIFLVDPDHFTLPSWKVLPQQVDWLRDATLQLCSRDPACRLSRLPLEILERIFDEFERSTARDRTLPEGCSLRLTDPQTAEVRRQEHLGSLLAVHSLEMVTDDEWEDEYGEASDYDDNDDGSHPSPFLPDGSYSQAFIDFAHSHGIAPWEIHEHDWLFDSY
ncbi:uncharacterized protein PSFLO_06651 [Pseudozyma flocculosa]|uniref:DUF4246 domain-containing protein n=1 Tax=Pseudozyma flocculosa TaxID=84751 RepID=A0A5C3FCT9_9BASI|nr:uncharacterized protein PSFLO_06651 [Pseudozyma flocculosa]